MKNIIITPKTIMLLLALLPISLRAQGLGQLLYESIYSATGKWWKDDGTVMHTSYGSAFYVEIFENCLVETSGTPKREFYYTYIGNNGQNSRIYCREYGNNNRFFYIVDQNYNLTKVYERDDTRFPSGKVKIYSYHEIKKGDHPHRTPIEILEDHRREMELWWLQWQLDHLS